MKTFYLALCLAGGAGILINTILFWIFNRKADKALTHSMETRYWNLQHVSGQRAGWCCLLTALSVALWQWG